MKAVECYWAKKIREITTWYPSLERLNSKIYKPKIYHSILDIFEFCSICCSAISLSSNLEFRNFIQSIIIWIFVAESRLSKLVSIWSSSLERLNSKIYKPKIYHSILDISRDLNPSKAEMTIGIKIRLVTGTYFLQEVRAKYACVSLLLYTKLRRSDLYITKDLTLEE
jgi:hypothetical protein